ncbi:glycosyltransferase [Arenibacter sp. GZD96]|uniref:glycosyltransferase n=1 Tax=Aurantibrevibacter litoralis TaxID=3106030 RepID=UPI002AFE0525|nr:glycosyltransferase [Arenibacter sp. GZD-96]MEA1787719.1 glycosyltransferase [Arenibacter sp. GZD-96]
MKIKIVFVLPSLRAGGAERVMSFIASHINNERFEASLLVIGNNKDQSYSVKEHTPITFLNKTSVRMALPATALYIYHNKPHIVIGAIAHVNFALSILAIFFRRVRFVGRETIVASALHNLEKSKPRRSFLPDLRRITLSKIVCQSNDMKEDLISNFGYPADKLIIIANPVTRRFKLKTKKQKKEPLQLITVGRLTKQKGYLRILNVLSRLQEPFEYTIIGSGLEKEAIISHAIKLNILDKITHIPFTSTVETYLAKSDLFLSGSYVEGFPNVFLESCAVGTPVLAFQAPGGINEIIINGVNGYTAINEQDFFEKLILCSKKSWDPHTIRHSVMNKYAKEIILNEYESLFLSLTV